MKTFNEGECFKPAISDTTTRICSTGFVATLPSVGQQNDFANRRKLPNTYNRTQSQGQPTTPNILHNLLIFWGFEILDNPLHKQYRHWPIYEKPVLCQLNISSSVQKCTPSHCSHFSPGPFSFPYMTTLSTYSQFHYCGHLAIIDMSMLQIFRLWCCRWLLYAATGEWYAVAGGRELLPSHQSLFYTSCK